MTSHRIALLFEYSTLNGGERSMLAALDWIRANNSRLEFVAIAPAAGRLAEALRERQIPIYDRPLNTVDGFPLAAAEIESQLEQIIRSCKADLLHANSLSMGRCAGRIASILKIPTTAHLRDIIKLSRTAINDLNHNSCLIAVSQATRAFHIGQGVSHERCRVVHNGVDLERFRPRTPTGRLHAELGLEFFDVSHGEFDRSPSAPKLIATIGQIGLRKGQDVLAAAAPVIVGSVPEAHFLIIGERSSQKLESIQFERSIQQSFDRLQLSDRLHLLGNRDDVCEILTEIDLLVHPANQEPYGRVLLEASASGVPIVATNVGGTGEIIVDGETGILVPPRDPSALADATVTLLTNTPKSDLMRARARERAVSHFCVANSARSLCQVWIALLNKPRQ